MSFGLPVVTTGIGAEGMNLTNEKEILLADNAREFADAVARLYQSPQLWQTLSDNSYNFIAENFSPRVVEQKIHLALEKVFDGKRELRR